MKLLPSLLATAASLALAVQAQSETVLPAVGPMPPGAQKAEHVGYLRVYTDTTQYNDGDIYYYPHTPYTVYRTDGSVAAHVDNHTTNSDEHVETVSLPAGTYRVKALSEFDGPVTVPVIIKTGHTTAVHLEKGRESDNEDIDPSRAVVAASGQVIGWRAENAK
ncbi:MAG TPA: hypothetical protein VIM58_07655 [Candidatus Methylacidiphilales bacterium]